VSTRRSDDQLSQAHLEHVRRVSGSTVPAPPRLASIDDAEPAAAQAGEWAAAPPGRLGRRLVADVERYLEFFAIARAD